MSRLILFTFSLCLISAAEAGAVPVAKKQLPPVVLKSVALGHESRKIDFNAMIDANEDRGSRLQNRIRTKMRGRALHLTRGRVHIVKSEPRGSRGRSEASVGPRVKARIRGRSKDVQVKLVPARRPSASTKISKNGN